ncbi:hypothetical protein, partial [Enterobacter hormaechei]|uniref:hypothetical protein n=1 Tax=Enterobacter hormaechei TaxID=158836 RepID=UPI001953A4AF
TFLINFITKLLYIKSPVGAKGVIGWDFLLNAYGRLPCKICNKHDCTNDSDASNSPFIKKNLRAHSISLKVSG